MGKSVRCKTPQCDGRIVIEAPPLEPVAELVKEDVGGESPDLRPARSIPPSPAAGPSRRSVLAIVSLLLGLFSFVGWFLSGIPAMITGVLALLKIGQSGGQLRGKGMAITGIVLGGTAPLPLTVAALLMIPVVIAAREAGYRTMSQNNLKQIGLAVQNYHDTFGLLPPGGTFDAKGTGHHGWQTMLLPFIEQAELYRRINFNLPWSAPENQSQFQTQIPTFRLPRNAETVDAKGFALSHYAGNSYLFGKNTSVRLKDITNGTGNTIMAGEANGNFKAWGNPENWRDPSVGIGTGPDSFGSSGTPGAAILMCDGSVRNLSANTDPNVLHTMALPNSRSDTPQPAAVAASPPTPPPETVDSVPKKKARSRAALPRAMNSDAAANRRYTALLRQGKRMASGRNPRGAEAIFRRIIQRRPGHGDRC